MKILNSFINTKSEYSLMQLRLDAIDNLRNYLERERAALLVLKDQHKDILAKIDAKLQELKGIEQELFYKIAIKGQNVTKSVDRVAMNNDVDSSTVWRKYSRNVKNLLEELKEKTDIENKADRR